MVENMKEEIWKDVPNYEGYYQASNLGRVRSLDRTVTYSDGRKRFYKGRVIEGAVGSNGYKYTTLSLNGIRQCLSFPQLVAMAFLGHEPNGYTLVVDHVNGDKSDDRVENIRIVTHRANVSTCFRSNEGSFSSHYVGVSWNEEASKWKAYIAINGKRKHLGYYDTELEASKAYQSALSKINEGSFDTNYYKPKFSSEYKGVSLHKATNKWRAEIRINGKRKHLGYHPTELEAYKARLKAEEEQKSA